MYHIREYFDYLLSNSAPDQPAWNIEAVREQKKAKWNYVDGCMIGAVLKMYFITSDKKYLSFADEFIGYYIGEDGSIRGYDAQEYNCDNINEGKVLFPLYELSGKVKYRKAMEKLYQQLLDHPRTRAGNFWHKKIYPHQVWLDGLYMVQPFYMEYERRFNQNRNFKDIIGQFEVVHQIMRDKNTNLLYHGYDESRSCFWADKETGRSKNFWSRALGWYVMALVDTISVMDEQLFYEYQKLQEYFREAASALLQVQDEKTKLFYQVTDQGSKAGNYLETSASCAIAYAFIKGARLSYLPKYYFRYGKEIFEAVLQHKLVKKGEFFVLKDICLVAGLGGMPGKGNYKVRDGSFEYYISEPIVEDDAKGAAPFFMAYTELCEAEAIWLQY